MLDTGCTEGLDVSGKPSPPTYYCSGECQEIHWKAHKPDCKGSNFRKQLYRTVEVAQRILFDSLRASFFFNLVQVVEKDGRLHVTECPRARNVIMVEFPKGLFANSKDEETVLAWGSGADQVVGMNVFMAAMLRGWTTVTDAALKKMHD